MAFHALKVLPYSVPTRIHIRTQTLQVLVFFKKLVVQLRHSKQNYLKRKANGKQQEYYERTKAKKKAEMDAKKEEIRQEDIAKGVFVPVSLLPPAEPKKGVASA